MSDSRRSHSGLGYNKQTDQKWIRLHAADTYQLKEYQSLLILRIALGHPQSVGLLMRKIR